MSKLLKLTQQEKDQLTKICSKLIGLPYKFGAEVDMKLSVDEVVKKRLSFDCSEYTRYVYRKIGYIVPDGSYNQYLASEEIPEDQMEVGDLVFRKKDGRIMHVELVYQVEPTRLVIGAVGSPIDKVRVKNYDDFIKPVDIKYSQFAGLRRFKIDNIVKI